MNTEEVVSHVLSKLGRSLGDDSSEAAYNIARIVDLLRRAGLEVVKARDTE